MIWSMMNQRMIYKIKGQFIFSAVNRIFYLNIVLQNIYISVTYTFWCCFIWFI